MKGRTYRYTTDVLFPFGFGLSYSKFQIGKANLSKANIKTTENILLNFSIKNTSKREGTEIVQVYVRKVNDTSGPLKTLKAFKRINLKSGESQNVTIDLPSSF
jgi:beta-glucosidase